MKLTLAVAALLTLTGAALADPHETQTFAGPYGTFFDDTSASNTTLNPSFTGTGYTPVGVRIVMDLTSVTAFTWANDVVVTCTPPVGASFDMVMTNIGEYATLTDVTRVVALPAGVNPVGTWSFLIWDAYQDGDGVTQESDVSNLRISLESPTPPAALELGTLSDGTLTRSDALAAGAVMWYKMGLPASNSFAAPKYIDITTNGSDIDSVIVLYANDGAFITGDDDGGVGATSFVSLGYGGGSTVGDAGAVSDGHNGKLAAGVYYLAVIDYGDGDWGFDDLWDAHPSAGGLAGTINLTVDIGNTPVGSPTLPAATDLGGIGGGAGGAEQVTTSSVALDAGAIQWLKFSIAGAVSDAAGKYLDIDTDVTSTINDTELALYAPNGLLIVTDDDDGDGLKSALSFGDTAPARAAIGAGAPGDGRDGALPAGTYYLATAQYNAAFANGFVATTIGATAGTIVVNFRTNLAPAVTVCSAADIGIQGGNPGQDNLLNNNDFIVFINFFFSQSPAADIGIQGGNPGHDTVWDNNDFIVFINIFFTDAANCTG